MSRELLVAVQTLLQTKACNVLCDVTGNQHQQTAIYPNTVYLYIIYLLD